MCVCVWYIAETQSKDPHITFNQDNYTSGDILDANCTSSPATPVPELTWLLNGKKVGTKFRSLPRFFLLLIRCNQTKVRIYSE